MRNHCRGFTMFVKPLLSFSRFGLFVFFLATFLYTERVCAETGAGPRARLGSEQAESGMRRRAIEGAVWGVPIVSVDAMRQAFFRDAGAKYNDIVFWSKPADWKNQTTTPNASSLYVYANFNLKDGPVVLEVPATVGAGMFGTILDAWQVPLSEVGPKGSDEGKGGKYVLLPPDFKGDPPVDHFPMRFATNNGYFLFRVIPATSSEEDTGKALSLVKKLRLYPLSEVGKPAEQRFIDMAGKLFDGIVRFDESFYGSLARMINEEPVQPRDLAVMGQLRALGIEKGKEFTPGNETREILGAAAREAHTEITSKFPDYGEVYWPGLKWLTPDPSGIKTGFKFETDNSLDVDSRAVVFFAAYAPPMKLGEATFYLFGSRDTKGELFDGSASYKLRVPAKVPAKQFWAVTAYDSGTAGFIRESPQVGVDSYGKMKKNADGSVDVYFGPKAPPGQEANWVYTAPGKRWFTFFRLYGPEQPLFDKAWKLPDVEKVSEKVS